jgi:hypothetical protein
MKYHCGHDGCDICGARTCAGASLKQIGRFLVCPACEILAVSFAVNAAETFGGTIIDPSKPCGPNMEKK